MYFPRIEDLRIDSDKKQYEIAAYLHLNREVYRRYEEGEREIPVWAPDPAGTVLRHHHGLHPGAVGPTMTLRWVTAGVVGGRAAGGCTCPGRHGSSRWG